MIPCRDGMLLEDFVDAHAFMVNGTLPAEDEWVTELRMRADNATLLGAI